MGGFRVDFACHFTRFFRRGFCLFECVFEVAFVVAAFALAGDKRVGVGGEDASRWGCLERVGGGVIHMSKSVPWVIVGGLNCAAKRLWTKRFSVTL